MSRAFWQFALCFRTDSSLVPQWQSSGSGAMRSDARVLSCAGGEPPTSHCTPQLMSSQLPVELPQDCHWEVGRKSLSLTLSVELRSHSFPSKVWLRQILPDVSTENPPELGEQQGMAGGFVWPCWSPEQNVSSLCHQVKPVCQCVSSMLACVLLVSLSYHRGPLAWQRDMLVLCHTGF